MRDEHLDGVDLNLLPALAALLSERSVSRAAKVLRLTQPAASRALGRLRRVLGDPLLVRRGRELVLTPRAERLIEPARRAMAAAGVVFRPDVAFDPARERWTVRLATSDHVQLALLPALGASLCEKAPGLSLLVRSVEVDTARQLEEAHVDLMVAPPSAARGTLRSAPLFDEPLVCLVRKDGRRRVPRLTEENYLAGEHVMAAPRVTPQQFLRAVLGEHADRLRVVFAVPSFSVVPWLVAERGGIGTLPMSVAARYAPLLDLAIVEPPFRLPSAQLAMIWHERSEADEGQRWFRSALASVARGVAVARPHRNGRT